jgi:hypothetical protein
MDASVPAPFGVEVQMDGGVHSAASAASGFIRLALAAPAVFPLATSAGGVPWNGFPTLNAAGRVSRDDAALCCSVKCCAAVDPNDVTVHITRRPSSRGLLFDAAPAFSGSTNSSGQL